MKQEQIIKGNKLIAEFMQYEIAGTDGTTSEVLTYYFPDNHPTHAGMVSADDLLFNSSWGWLIPAWIKFYQEAFKARLGSDDYIKHLFNLRALFHSRIDEGKCEGAFKVLVEGIVWYNKIKPIKKS